MGGPKPPKQVAQPKAPDTAKARVDALAYAEIERRIRMQQGRAGAFITRKPSMQSNQFKTLLGQ